MNSLVDGGVLRVGRFRLGVCLARLSIDAALSLACWDEGFEGETAFG